MLNDDVTGSNFTTLSRASGAPDSSAQSGGNLDSLSPSYPLRSMCYLSRCIYEFIVLLFALPRFAAARKLSGMKELHLAKNESLITPCIAVIVIEPRVQRMPGSSRRVTRQNLSRRCWNN